MVYSFGMTVQVWVHRPEVQCSQKTYLSLHRYRMNGCSDYTLLVKKKNVNGERYSWKYLGLSKTCLCKEAKPQIVTGMCCCKYDEKLRHLPSFNIYSEPG